MLEIKLIKNNYELNNGNKQKKAHQFGEPFF